MNTSLLHEFWRLRDNASAKREQLLIIAHKQSLRLRRLNIAAGILALLSAASVSALIADLFSARWVKIVAVIFSTTSGLISLMLSTGYKENEINDLNGGAAGYLDLRERAHRQTLNASLDDTKALDVLSELQGQYTTLDHKFQRYITRDDPGGWRRQMPPGAPDLAKPFGALPYRGSGPPVTQQEGSQPFPRSAPPAANVENQKTSRGSSSDSESTDAESFRGPGRTEDHDARESSGGSGLSVPSKLTPYNFHGITLRWPRSDQPTSREYPEPTARATAPPPPQATPASSPPDQPTSEADEENG